MGYIMQTFLPYPDIRLSVGVIDNKRLGKQRVEAMQILNILEGIGNMGWANHPAVTMWRGHKGLLTYYMNACIDEWELRNFNNTMDRRDIESWELTFPWWWAHDYFHKSHQSNLLRKDFDHYDEIFDLGEDNWLYLWPGEKQEDGFRTVVPKWAKKEKFFNPLTLEYENI